MWRFFSIYVRIATPPVRKTSTLFRASNGSPQSFSGCCVPHAWSMMEVRNRLRIENEAKVFYSLEMWIRDEEVITWN